MNGFQLHKLNIEATTTALEALRACDRLHRKAHGLILQYGETGLLPDMIFELYGTAPMTAHALKRWLEETSIDPKVLNYRLDTCIGILQNELRANHMFEQLSLKLAKPIRPAD